MLRAIIIEDEEQKRLSLKRMITALKPDVEITGEAEDIKTALVLIKKQNPDLIFLDIKLPDGTGFDLLEQLSNVSFKIIFVTAFEEYAVKAFKFSAVDYIMKPVAADELIEAIDKAINLIWAEHQLKINTLIQNHNTLAPDEKRIILKTIDKVHVVKMNEIVRCESDASYCHFLLNDGKKITVSKPLKEYAGMFYEYGFFRVHKSHLVNIRLVKRFERSEGGYVIMENDDKVPVSSYKRDELLEFLETI